MPTANNKPRRGGTFGSLPKYRTTARHMSSGTWNKKAVTLFPPIYFGAAGRIRILTIKKFFHILHNSLFQHTSLIYRNFKSCYNALIWRPISHAVSNVGTVRRIIYVVNVHRVFYKGNALRNIVCKVNVVYLYVALVSNGFGVANKKSYGNIKIIRNSH